MECIRAVFVFVFFLWIEWPVVHMLCERHQSTIVKYFVSVCYLLFQIYTAPPRMKGVQEQQKNVTIKVVGKYNHGHLIECVVFIHSTYELFGHSENAFLNAHQSVTIKATIESFEVVFIHCNRLRNWRLIYKTTRLEANSLVCILNVKKRLQSDAFSMVKTHGKYGIKPQHMYSQWISTN